MSMARSEVLSSFYYVLPAEFVNERQTFMMGVSKKNYSKSQSSKLQKGNEELIKELLLHRGMHAAAILKNARYMLRGGKEAL